MLIVVAIIAILIAISIPLINNALNKAKHATDAANERAAKAEILLQYMAEGGTTIKADTVYYYDAADGKVAETMPKAYGKHKVGTSDDTDHEKKWIALKVTTSGEVKMKWVKATASESDLKNENLCSNASNDSHS